MWRYGAGGRKGRATSGGATFRKWKPIRSSDSTVREEEEEECYASHLPRPKLTCKRTNFAELQVHELEIGSEVARLPSPPLELGCDSLNQRNE